MAKLPVNFKILMRQINAIRVACNPERQSLMKMPQGEPGHSYHCPVALALSNGIGVSAASDEICLSFPRTYKRPLDDVFADLKQAGFRVSRRCSREIGIEATPTMSNFINRFDAGDFEHLVEGVNYA